MRGNKHVPMYYSHISSQYSDLGKKKENKVIKYFQVSAEAELQ